MNQAARVTASGLTGPDPKSNLGGSQSLRLSNLSRPMGFLRPLTNWHDLGPCKIRPLNSPWIWNLKRLETFYPG